ncbi:MAG: hypothetical protein DMF14_09655 [Verrucomicrobia bacterium]|nr:MAG: hypothetical protein DME40_10695 [Verrucomicrobiota bacterium]PYL90489.1 MAG: hypothetical protein DMF14_09655 [Verrucomicrobiota bacterium]
MYFGDNLSWLRNRDEFPNESVDLAFHFADAREWSASLSLNRVESLAPGRFRASIRYIPGVSE